MTAHEALQRLSQLESRGFDPKFLNALCSGHLDDEIDEEFFCLLFIHIEMACTEYKGYKDFKDMILETKGVIHDTTGID